MSEDDDKRITKLEVETSTIRSDVAHVANTIQDNSKKLDSLISSISKLDSKTDVTIQALEFMQDDHKELRIDYNSFRHKEYDRFKASIHEKISNNKVSIAKVTGVAGGASAMVYGLIEALKNWKG